MSDELPNTPSLYDPFADRAIGSSQISDYHSFVVGQHEGYEPVAVAFRTGEACLEWITSEQAAGRLPAASVVRGAELEAERRRPAEECLRKQADIATKVARFAAETGLEANSVELVRRAIAEGVADDPTILYEGRFGGQSVSVWVWIPDLNLIGWNRRASSAAVIPDFISPGLATLCTERFYQGQRFHMFGFPFAQFDLAPLGFAKDTQSFAPAWVF